MAFTKQLPSATSCTTPFLERNSSPVLYCLLPTPHQQQGTRNSSVPEPRGTRALLYNQLPRSSVDRWQRQLSIESRKYPHFINTVRDHSRSVDPWQHQISIEVSNNTPNHANSTLHINMQGTIPSSVHSIQLSPRVIAHALWISSSTRYPPRSLTTRRITPIQLSISTCKGPSPRLYTRYNSPGA
jgi:hypothetical protein